MPIDKDAKIFIAGHKGLVGSALVRFYQSQGYENILTRSRSECDLLDPVQVQSFLEESIPDYVFCAAAKVGGIHANSTCKGAFIYENLMIQTNLIHYSHKVGVKKLLFLGSSCIYPKFSSQPIKEESFLTGSLEQTNDAYAVAKIAGITMCQAYNSQYGTQYISVMPTNMYGPNDNYDLESSHVLPALIRRCHDAKYSGKPSLTIWGTGKPRREFLYADDCARACHFLMEEYHDSSIINIGTGQELSIAELINCVKDVVGYSGDIMFDDSMPDGVPRKLLDCSKIEQLGWTPSISLTDGIRLAYDDFLTRL